MTRKIIILALGYFVLGVLSFTSCDFSYEATICDIEFAGLHSIGKVNSNQPDTFDDQIGFEIMSRESAPTCYIPSVQVFNTAYATTKCAEFDNQLLKSSYKLSFDRPFALGIDTISANTEILSIPEIKSLTEITINEQCELVTSRIILKSELIDQIRFEAGEYEVTFKCSTSDNKEFTKTRKVIFKE